MQEARCKLNREHGPWNSGPPRPQLGCRVFWNLIITFILIKLSVRITSPRRGFYKKAFLFKQHIVKMTFLLSLDAWRVPLKVSAELLMVCQVNTSLLLLLCYQSAVGVYLFL